MLIKLLDEASNEKILDTRVVERNKAKGLITQEQYNKSLEKLPDDAANAEFLTIDQIQDSGSR
jgi:hypothetical protein